MFIHDSVSSTTSSDSNSFDDVWASSPAAQSLFRLQANSRVKYIVVNVPSDACPACQSLAGTYPKDRVPILPLGLCSHPLGCRAFYAPYLDDIYP